MSGEGRAQPDTIPPKGGGIQLCRYTCSTQDSAGNRFGAVAAYSVLCRRLAAAVGDNHMGIGSVSSEMDARGQIIALHQANHFVVKGGVYRGRTGKYQLEILGEVIERVYGFE